MSARSGKPGTLLSALVEGMAVNAEIPPIEVTGITADSRSVETGVVFVALKGIQTHGIDFAIDAARAGATVILYDALDDYCRRRIPLLRKQVETHWLGVDSLDRFNGVIVSRFFGEPGRDMSIIGVTGTDGKSSVTHLLVQALTRLGKAAGSIGTLGYGMANDLQVATHTTPDAVALQTCLHDFRRQGCEYVVMEVSSHALEQYRVNGCQFDIAVLTNLGRDHLDYHGDLDNYAAAKARLFTEYPLGARVLNLNDEFGRRLALQDGPGDILSYSSDPLASMDVSVRLGQRDITPQGQDITAKTPLGDIRASSALLGEFNVDNMLACIASLVALGFDRDQIADAVSGLKPIPGRMEKFTGAQDQATAVVDFAHTEQALRASLASIRAHTRGRLWCVFGCGGDRDRGKRGGMGRAAEQLADRVVVTDDNPRTESAEAIVADILAGMNNPQAVSVVHDRQAAIEFALSSAGSEDIVVIAGKGHEQEQIIGRERYPFSDRHVVQRLMRGER